MDVDMRDRLLEPMLPGAEYMVRARVALSGTAWDGGDHVRMALSSHPGRHGPIVWVPREIIFPLSLGIVAVAAIPRYCLAEPVGPA